MHSSCTLGVLQVCARCAPGVLRVCSRFALGVLQVCSGGALGVLASLELGAGHDHVELGALGREDLRAQGGLVQDDLVGGLG